MGPAGKPGLPGPAGNPGKPGITPNATCPKNEQIQPPPCKVCPRGPPGIKGWPGFPGDNGPVGTHGEKGMTIFEQKCVVTSNKLELF